MPISVDDWKVSKISTFLKPEGTSTAPKQKRPEGCTITKKDVPFYPCPFGKPHVDCIGKACNFMEEELNEVPK